MKVRRQQRRRAQARAQRLQNPRRQDRLLQTAIATVVNRFVEEFQARVRAALAARGWDFAETFGTPIRIGAVPHVESWDTALPQPEVGK